MGVTLSGVGSLIKESMNTTRSNGEPDWTRIPTKSKSTRTAKEFCNAIKELARKAATVTDQDESYYVSNQVIRLRVEYLSEVSPDRKHLYKEAKATINHYGGNPKCKCVGELSLIDFLKKNQSKSRTLATEKFALASGGTLSFTILTTGGYGAEIRYQGTRVLSDTGAGWGYEMTNAERAKEKEFYSIYWSEYNSVKGKDAQEWTDVQDYLVPDRPVFIAKA